MLGPGAFIKRFPAPIQAELALMKHYAQRQHVLKGWDRRYAHMQFVLRWAPVFRRHVSVPQSSRSPKAA